MTMQEFLDDQEHFGVVLSTVRAVIDDPNYCLDKDEAEDWVLNHEGLYRYAIANGVELEDEEGEQ